MGLGSIAWQTCLRPPPGPDNQGLIMQMQGVPYTPSLRRYFWSGTARSGHPKRPSCTQNGLFRAWSAGSKDSYHRSSSDLIRLISFCTDLIRPPFFRRSLCSSEPRRWRFTDPSSAPACRASGTNRQAIEQSIDRAKVAREGRVAEERRVERSRRSRGCLLFNKNTRNQQ